LKTVSLLKCVKFLLQKKRRSKDRRHQRYTRSIGYFIWQQENREKQKPRIDGSQWPLSGKGTLI